MDPLAGQKECATSELNIYTSRRHMDGWHQICLIKEHLLEE